MISLRLGSLSNNYTVVIEVFYGPVDESGFHLRVDRLSTRPFFSLNALSNPPLNASLAYLAAVLLLHTDSVTTGYLCYTFFQIRCVFVHVDVFDAVHQIAIALARVKVETPVDSYLLLIVYAFSSFQVVERPIIAIDRLQDAK